MNAKKKNKKANKPPNPKPPQNVVIEPKREDIVPEISKSEVKEEKIIIPEIPSEVVTAPVSDIPKIKEILSETPKKPKRNKGKKKKQDKEEELLEDVQVKPKEILSEATSKVPEPVQEITDVETLNEENKALFDDSCVLPSARKKKNKNKNQNKSTEELKIDAAVPIPVPPPLPAPPEESKADNTNKIDSEIQELFLPKPETPKQDAKKKKNKKKNRTDSERSDKSDNAMLCTSSFQKLIVDDNSLKSTSQDQIDLIVEGNQELKTNVPLVCDSKITTKDVQAMGETEPLKEIKEAQIIKSETVKEFPKDELQSKKKNKKDKKQPQIKQVGETKVTIENTPTSVVDVLLHNVFSAEPKKDRTVKKESSPHQIDQPQATESVKIPQLLTEESQSELNIEKERSPKLKAKIAKPVEKKRKGKHESVSSENLSTIECLEIKKEDNKDVSISKETEINLEDISTENTIKPDDSKQTIDLGSTSVVIPIENISIPSDNSMGKKRKKSPNPSQNKSDNVNLPKEQQTQLAESSNTIKVVSDMLPEIVIASSQPEKKASKLLETPPIQITQSLTDSKIDSSDTKLLERAVTPEIQKDDEGFETKTSKKKKKTPKISQVIEATKIKEILKSEDNEGKSGQIAEKNVGVCNPFDVPFPVDLELRNVKTEDSEALSCDLTPDVLFLRSSSQHLDDNNNTVIQEIMHVEDTKISDSLIIPTIEGSGETPVSTPELISSGIRMTEFEQRTPTEEKTDIKSKMMEVNQDMEELRLSIERSLAEFTALEKSEQDEENKFEADNILKSPLKQTDTKPTAFEKIKSDIKENIPSKVFIKEPDICESLVSPTEVYQQTDIPPVCPTRKDNKGKSKNKKKGKQEPVISTTATTIVCSDSTTTQSKDNTVTQKEEKQEKTEQKSDQKSESSQDKGKQQSANTNDVDSKDSGKEKQPTNSEFISDPSHIEQQNEYEPIENFEDALTSSVDDLNKTFELIVKQADDENEKIQKKLAANKPEINIVEPSDGTETNKSEKVNPVSQPKNLLGQTDIPVQSNKTDYKKEKNKTPNARQATVKIKDSMDIETKKESKESQTDSKKIKKISHIKSVKESFSRVKNDNEEYVYKYSFRKVFLQSACHVCNKDLSQVRVPCGYCSLVFYCGARHKDEDWPLHQALCFAVSTLAHMKGQKHLYADAQHATGQDYRLLRMQMIVSCEKMLKRRLVPWEQEAMLYPRLCADVACREWRQDKLQDCDGCGQVSFCTGRAEHLPRSHARWCKSYSLYRNLVTYQQSHGRLDPPLPTKVLDVDHLPVKMNEVLASLYEEKLDMKDIEYAALTQLATAPLTVAHSLQLCRPDAKYDLKQLTVHVVGAELQCEADALHKWERFLLHARRARSLAVALVAPRLNPGNLPTDLLAKLRLCDDCRQNKRRLVFKFEDNKNYFEYRTSEDFINPDIICAFNPSIQRSSLYNAADPWPANIDVILRLRQPFVLTAHTLTELRKDVARIRELAQIDFKLILEPGYNNFASVRPDRNFISDDEMPLLFKNYCVAVLIGC